jgi:hypothetical protein
MAAPSHISRPIKPLIVIIVATLTLGGALSGALADHGHRYRRQVEPIEPAAPATEPLPPTDSSSGGGEQTQQRQPIYSLPYNLAESEAGAPATDERDDNPAELDFKLMNAAHDRLQAVKSLLNATRHKPTPNLNENQTDQQSQMQGKSARWLERSQIDHLPYRPFLTDHQHHLLIDTTL